MKIKIAKGTGWCTSKVWKALDSLGLWWLTNLFDKILVNGKILEAWRKIVWYQFLWIKEIYRNVGIIEG